MANRSFTINPWVIEDRLALVPLVGKVLAESLPRADLLEERIPFGPHSHQVVHLFWPAKNSRQRRSAVLFLHGGGWCSGAPQLFRFVGHFFAELGFPTLVGGYRLAPEFHLAAQLADVRAGLSAGLRALASGGTALDRVIAGGQSAGAHLAGLLVYDRSQGGGIDQSLFGGYYSISGPLDFSACTHPALQQMIADLLGGESRPAADPIGQIRGGERVPALLIHGDRDPLVDIQNALSFADRLKDGGSCPVEVHIVRGGHHADLAALFLKDLSVTRALERWLTRIDLH